MTTSKTLAIGAAVALLALPLAAAQAGGRGRPGRLYNPATVITVTGTVDDVQQVTRGRGWQGTHLTLNTGKETVDVHLGPSSFLADKQFTFAKGDRIEVTGSKVKFGDADALIAREVKKGGKTLVLRDADGIPQWSRGPRR
jgi:hypothetical protein